MNTLLSAALLLVSLSISPPTLAEGGTLQFEGVIFESGCDVSATPDAVSDFKLQVTPANDACSRDAPAFTADYQPLSATETDLDDYVITLTYN